MNMDFVYDKEDDIHYVCSLLDFIARKTDNYISDVISYFNVNEISWHLKYAHVNHCATFDDIAEKVISNLQIHQGSFARKEDEPDFIEVGALYKTLVMSYCLYSKQTLEECIIKVLASPISKTLDKLSFKDLETESKLPA